MLFLVSIFFAGVPLFFQYSVFLGGERKKLLLTRIFTEIVVYCPESKTAEATQEPVRKDIHGGDGAKEISPQKSAGNKKRSPATAQTKQPEPGEQPSPEVTLKENAQEPKEQHFTIHYGCNRLQL